MKYLNNENGFTLAELMVSVVIVIVLIAIAGTTWILSLNHLSLRNDARDIKDALVKARSLAINSGRNHQVYFDTANEVYQIEDCNLGGNNDLCIADEATVAPNFGGTGLTHGTVVGSLTDVRIARFGHKPTDLINIVEGGAAAQPVNCVRFKTDGTAEFFNSGIRSNSTTLRITLGRTDGSPDTRTIEVNNIGRAQVQ